MSAAELGLPLFLDFYFFVLLATKDFSTRKDNSSSCSCQDMDGGKKGEISWV